MRLSGETAKAPVELADAMFFITSAGLRGADALAVLEISAKGAAAGLGETAVVADLVTSAVNAYGIENLSAAKATDILTAAVREGKAEAPELAESLGQVLPIASALEVSFDQVGAAVASMTRTGTKATTASIQLRQILASLLKPTQMAEDAMVEMGTSGAELRKQLREKGLISVLGFLAEQLKTNEQAMAQVFPNIRALSGALDIMGGNAEENIGIFERMTDVTGMTEKAFAVAAKTAHFQFNQALSELKQEMIALGVTLMPIFKSILNSVRNGVRWFKNLSDISKKVGIVLAGVAIAAGPVIYVLGVIASLIGAITWPIVAVIAAIAALTVAFLYVADNWEAITQRISDWSWWKNTIIDMTAFLIRNNPPAWLWKGFQLVIPLIKQGWTKLTAFLTDISWWKGLLSDMGNWFNTHNPYSLMMDAVSYITGEAIPGVSEAWLKSMEAVESTTEDFDWGELWTDPFETIAANLETTKEETIKAKKEFGSFTDAMVNGANKAKAAISGLFTSGGSGGGGGGGAGATGERKKPEETLKYTGLGTFKMAETNIKGVKTAMNDLVIASTDLGTAVQNSLNGAFVDLGETLGSIFSGDAGASSFFESIMLSVSSFLGAFGKALIAAGVAGIAFQNLLSNPYAAIGAGVALIAAAAVVRNVIQKGAQKNMEGLRSGGFVTEGGAFQLHKDEVVSLPAGSAVTSQKDSRALGGGVQIADVKIKGEDMYLIFKEAERRLGNSRG